MTSALKWPILGVLLAILVTTTMDATGLTNFSALPLLPLMLLFWHFERLSRSSLGFTWGRWRHYGLAALYPVVVLSAIALISTATGAVDLSHTNWRKAAINFALVSLSTFLGVIVTEEGFFRGWLWASLRRAGKSETAILIWSSIAFSAWHFSAVTLHTGFDLPRWQIPLFMVNAAVLGLIWGLLRWISGSILVASLSHGLWNGMDYVFFGFGTRAGALGIAKTWIYGPEVGFLGLALNIAFAAVLWRWWKGRAPEAAKDPPGGIVES
jgi:membrane protease YdiL (CAAX protease family)